MSSYGESIVKLSLKMMKVIKNYWIHYKITRRSEGMKYMDIV